jgi:hypothetical protein
MIVFYRLFFVCQPANLLRSGSITHTIAPCQDRMETAHGNLPKIGHDSIYLALGDGYWQYCLWVAPISTHAIAFSEAAWKFPSLCCALPRHTENRHP